MTLQELIETNDKIRRLDIDVREGERRVLIQSYHIGPYEEEDKYAKFGIKPKWITIRKPINYKDIGRDYSGVFTKNIPEKLLQLTVISWNFMELKFIENASMLLRVWLAGDDDAVAVIEKEERKELDKKCQIEGQMMLEL